MAAWPADAHELVHVAPVTALLSPRRAPDALRDLIADARLDARLDGFLNPATDLAALAQKVYAAGVRHVAGGVGIVDDAYDNERRVPTWKPAYTTDGDVGPIGALAVDDGFMSYSPRLVAAPDPGIAAGDAL